MTPTFYFILFIFGTIFGSFASVIITRLYSGEKGIVNGRSHCTICNKILKVIDLIPILSFFSTLGKCRYCKAKLSLIYPLLELSTGILFTLIGHFLIDFNILFSYYNTEMIKLLFWLIIGVITIIYIFYDILFLEIHEGVMIFGVIIAFLGLVCNTFFFPILPTFLPTDIPIYLGLYSIIISVLILGGLYMIMIKEFTSIYDILILIGSILLIIGFKYFFSIENLSDIPLISGTIGALGIFIFFYLQILLSKGKALGGGDLRIGIFVGLMLGVSYSITGMILTYVIGSIISIIYIIYKKIKNGKKKIDNVIPFGPFIGLGFFATIFFLPQIQKIIEIYFYTM